MKELSVGLSTRSTIRRRCRQQSVFATYQVCDCRVCAALTLALGRIDGHQPQRTVDFHTKLQDKTADGLVVAAL